MLLTLFLSIVLNTSTINLTSFLHCSYFKTVSIYILHVGHASVLVLIKLLSLSLTLNQCKSLDVFKNNLNSFD